MSPTARCGSKSPTRPPAATEAALCRPWNAAAAPRVDAATSSGARKSVPDVGRSKSVIVRNSALNGANLAMDERTVAANDRSVGGGHDGSSVKWGYGGRDMCWWCFRLMRTKGAHRDFAGITTRALATTLGPSEAAAAGAGAETLGIGSGTLPPCKAAGSVSNTGGVASRCTRLTQNTISLTGVRPISLSRRPRLSMAAWIARAFPVVGRVLPRVMWATRPPPAPFTGFSLNPWPRK
mmetsp:Transcript_11072/g.34290  ORF Transcript_11072/g.34290 Transcript_11072/m.34290 type:complete len:237 (-) Transcript_11072:966-1676(-)